MNKRIFTIAMIIFAVSGLAIAQGTVEATGDGNTAYISQVGSVGNVASIRQIGDDNLATVDQDSTAGGKNYVRPTHNIFSAGQNTWGIYQNGSRNEAHVAQGPKNDTASIAQVGNDNIANIVQDITAPGNGYAIGLIYQGGNENVATITQHGGVFNHAKVYQTGNTNEASVTQEGSYNNYNAEPTLDCPAIPSWSPLAAFDIAVYNHGTYRIPVTQYQEGNGNFAGIDVLGNYNNTTQWQQGDDNYATIDIIGDGNQAKQVQLNSNNLATINIVGNDNQAGTYQDIGGQTASITITGNGCNAYVTQTGSVVIP